MGTSFDNQGAAADRHARDAQAGAAKRVIRARQELQSLEYDLLLTPGMHEVSQAVRRAYLELAHPSVEGPLNHLEVDSTGLQPGEHTTADEEDES